MKNLRIAQENLSIVRTLISKSQKFFEKLDFLKMKMFQNFCFNFDRKFGVSNDKSKVIKVLQSNHIDSNCLYSQKRLILKIQLITVAFSIPPCKKNGCGRPHPDMIF